MSMSTYVNHNNRFERTNNDVTMKVCVRKPGENIRRHPVMRNKQTRGRYGEFQLAPACDLEVEDNRLKVHIYKWNTNPQKDNPFDVQGRTTYSLPLDYVEPRPNGNGFIVETPEWTWEFVSLHDYWKFGYHADIKKISALMQEIRNSQANTTPEPVAIGVYDYAGVC